MSVKSDKPFSVISSADNRFKFWVPKPDANGRMFCTMSFNATKYLPFIDAINTLSYVTVNRVQAVDDDLSTIDLVLTGENCLTKFVEDVPELIYDYVECCS